MNEEIKAKWVAALRSGEYKQTSGTLKDENAYCCLGVLSEILGHENYRNGGWVSPQGDSLLTAAIPDYVFDDELGFGVFDVQTQLWNLNDCSDIGFSEIASWIEENIV